MIVPEKISPEIIAPPKPRQSGSDKVMGTSPKMAVKEVRAMASSRLEAPSAMAMMKDSPDC